jgi:predicted dehydrogenase
LTPHDSSRRDFLKASAATVVGATLASAPPVHAAGSDELRVGLIGCGGRGTGAAEQCVSAGPNVKLVAMGDMFLDRLERSRKVLRENVGDKCAVKDENCFFGFDAYKGVLASGVDVVCLATPPHFRPAHIKAAVEAGKHIFAEKPVAVDAPGVRSVLASCLEAKRKGLAVVSGLCWRYHYGMRETFKRIHDGGVGDIVAMQCSYNTGPLWKHDRQPGWSDMEWQLRNWLYFTWLSGDHNVEQHIHSLDKMAWAMRDEYPVRAIGLGGRQVRTEPEYGHIFDHHAVVYEYANGVKAFSFCRQQANCHNDVSDHIMGTKGTCDVMKHRITGPQSWQYPPRQAKQDPSMYQIEHNELIASIRAGKPINDGDWMTKSTLLAIMGRMATYTGQLITWEMALNSQEDLTPEQYEFGPLPVPPVAKPGFTRFS